MYIHKLYLTRPDTCLHSRPKTFPAEAVHLGVLNLNDRVGNCNQWIPAFNRNRPTL